jgi:hypothetical protein
MRNLAAVTAHQRKAGAGSREVLTLIPALDGKEWFIDPQGEYWRVFDFISDTIALDRAEGPEDFRESAGAFGLFLKRLADFPAATLCETIPHFHDTPRRFSQFREALEADSRGRAKETAREIDFALAREKDAAALTRLQAAGELPLRVTHNDTKLNNVLFDRETRKALCVIDLDTVMPGLSALDFGDAIRFGASTAAEDEPDTDKMHFSLPLYRIYSEGYLSACGDVLTPEEKEALPVGARLITLEQGVRFLTDYLAGDIYYQIRREKQNLDRCRTQFKLLAGMEEQAGEMSNI